MTLGKTLGRKLASAIVFVTALTGCSQSVLPPFSLRTVDNTEQRSADTCAGKEHCVIAYFAPWCPICHRSTPFIRELRKQLDLAPTVGLNVIVGNDKLVSCEEFATEIGGRVYLDSRDEFDKIASFSSVPHFWVLDRERKVLEDFSWTGSHDDDVPGAVRAFIEQKLGLGDVVPVRPTKYSEQNL